MGMKQKLLSAWLVATALLFALTACQDPEITEEPDLSDKASLQRLAFTPNDNPSMGNSGSTAVLANDYYCISVPEGVDRSKLVPEILCSEGASVFIDDKPYTKGTAYDFSGNVQTIKIVSESGNRTANYMVLVKHGIPYIDNQVYEFMNDFHVPGVSISIMKGTEMKYSSGYGFAIKADQVRTTPDHLFRMASISKQFCTLCIMRLKEQGRLSLDQQVFGEKGILHGLYHNVTSYHEMITVRHLLSHSSGICKGLSDPAFTNSYRFYSGTSNPVPTDTLIQRTLDARQQPYSDNTMVWSPGMGYNYSNVGFCILHRVVEVISGKDYESFLKEDVLEPMGVTDTHIGGYEYQRRPNECVYYMQEGTNGYANPLRELAGAAGIITSTNQMMRVLTFIDGDDSVPDLFSRETLDEMYTPYSYMGNGNYGAGYKRYGLGWRMNHSSLFQGAHYHGGNIAGTATIWAGDTDQHMSGAFVCNSRAYNSNSSGDIDDNMYILLNRFMKYFDN